MVTLSCQQENSNNQNIPLPDTRFSRMELKKSAPDKETITTVSPYDDIARFLSGLPCSSPSLQKLQNTDVWKTFAGVIDSKWTALENKRFKSMKTWADTVLAEANKKTELVFYPFGGPDFMTAFQFFPDAETYMLVGLEPPGNLPDVIKWKPQHMESYMEDMKISLYDYFLKSYFITRDMNETLQGYKVEGVLPLICFFLKRSDSTIIDIRRIEFDEKGNTIETPYKTLLKRIKRPYGIRIDYITNATHRHKTVYFFSCDLSDESFHKNSKFFLYLDKIEAMTVFTKSASYLLHYNNFTNIRNMILAKSQCILQDDTGIPYRYFKENIWEIRLYGQYTKPVKDFSGVEQHDLEAAYKKSAPGKLPFHLGYHWENNLDGLMLITRK